MATKKKKIGFISPVITSSWSKLLTPDVYVSANGKKSAPKYVGQGYVETKDVTKLRDFLEKAAKKLCPDFEGDLKIPLREEKKDKKPTGKFILVAKSGAKYKPPMFDAKNNRLPDGVDIGGGTLMKMDCSIDVLPDGDGIHLYLNALQILDLKENEQGKSKFAEADGYTYEGKGDEPESGFTASDDADGEDGDSAETYAF